MFKCLRTWKQSQLLTIHTNKDIILQLIIFSTMEIHPRNLRYHIECKVKERMKQYEGEVQSRKQKLRELFEYENALYEKEIQLLRMKQEEDRDLSRREWIDMQAMKNRMQEEEFIRNKTLQREIENNESARELESQRIVLETKLAQMYQIEEKKVLRLKEKRMDNYWLEVAQKEKEKKEKQAEYESKLRQVTAKLEQQQNLKCQEISMIMKRREKQSSDEQESKRHNADLENEKRLQDRKHLEDERMKMYQHNLLAEQINQNLLRHHAAKLSEKEECLLKRAIDNEALTKSGQKHILEKIANREWHKSYLDYEKQQKSAKVQMEKSIDNKLGGNYCVLDQTSKRPYNKNTR